MAVWQNFLLFLMLNIVTNFNWKLVVSSHYLDLALKTGLLGQSVLWSDLALGLLV
jgi:hypothetical protein